MLIIENKSRTSEKKSLIDSLRPGAWPPDDSISCLNVTYLSPDLNHSVTVTFDTRSHK